MERVRLTMKKKGKDISYTDEEIKNRLEIVRRSAEIWKIKKTGVQYVKSIRKESEKRLKRMGL